MTEDKSKCADCLGTGWVGDKGPGIEGNSEYHECHCVRGQERRQATAHADHWSDCWRNEGHHNCAIARVVALQVKLDEWERLIGAEMPDDFKDWHANLKEEHPFVAAGVLKQRQVAKEELVDALDKALDRAERAEAAVERVRETCSTQGYGLQRFSGSNVVAVDRVLDSLTEEGE